MPDHRESFRPRKRLGQHFLVDPNTVRKIVAEVDAEEGATVVEIGPGRGALTAELFCRYPDMIAVEVDPRSVEFLKGKFSGIDVREMDVLSVDWRELMAGRGGPLVVVGNLPYNITSQILFGLLEAGCASSAVLTMQKEVAERLVAVPRTKEYGILSVIVQLMTVPSIRFHLSPNVFYPKPEVWSSTVRLDWSAERAAPVPSDPAFLRQLVRTAFNQRRKMLRNSLSLLGAERGFHLPDRVATKRAEELSPLEFLQLAEELLADSR